jgi:hypothetical protein
MVRVGVSEDGTRVRHAFTACALRSAKSSLERNVSGWRRSKSGRHRYVLRATMRPRPALHCTHKVAVRRRSSATTLWRAMRTLRAPLRHSQRQQPLIDCASASTQQSLIARGRPPLPRATARTAPPLGQQRRWSRTACRHGLKGTLTTLLRSVPASARGGLGHPRAAALMQPKPAADDYGSYRDYGQRARGPRRPPADRVNFSAFAPDQVQVGCCERRALWGPSELM